MREFLGIGFGTESQFIVDYYRRLDQFGDLAVDANLNRLIDSLLAERWFKRSNKFNDFRTSREEIVAHITKRTFAGVLDAIFSLFAGKLGLHRWGDKTPGYIHHMEIIYELFPEAQYVYLVRDGRDVALSLRHINFGPKNMFCAAQDWAETVRAGDRFAESLPAGKLIYFTYEKMIADPTGTFRNLAEFLQIDLDETLSHRLAHDLPAKIKSGNSDKWRTAFSPKQLAAYDRIAFNELNKHGYDTCVTQAAPPAGPLLTAYWSALSELGKWRFAEYWRDNLYKLKLRSRRLFGS